MSVKRVSDLPSIEGLSANPEALGRFMKSFMEVSYLSAEQGSQVYASRKVKVNELLDNFRNIYYSKTPITGNISVNWNSDDSQPYGTYGEYAAKICEGRIDITVDNGFYVNGALTADTISTKTVSWGNYGSNSVVTKNAVEGRLIELSNDIIAKIEEIKQNVQGGTGKFPFLTFVYSDHEISDPGWVEQGSKIDLNQYKDLSSCLNFEGGILYLKGYPLPTAESGSDSYYNKFVLEDNYLTLPSFTSCFFETRLTKNDDISAYAGKQVFPGLPNIKGAFGQLPSSSTTYAQGAFTRTSNTF